MAAQIAAVLEQIGGAYARIVHPDARHRPTVVQQATASAETDAPDEPTAAAESVHADEPVDRPAETPVRTFRIFVGSSSGASREAAAMREIVDRINAGAASALRSRYELDLWTDTTLPLGETTKPLVEQLAAADVYVGIVSGGLGPGAEDEFEMVTQQFSRTGKPRIRFYIDPGPATANPDAAEAIARQAQFQQLLQRKDTSFRLYDGAAAFRDRVEHDLSRLLADLDAEASAIAPAPRRTCFVVMGFGEKTDFPTGRVIDLDRSYRMIKAAVEDAGLRCVRADEVIHSGTIDKVVFEFLFQADVVIADLSTANANAIYELGVRLALRPAATIVIAEKEFKFPFDLGHLLVRPYEHLGKGIAVEEHERVRDELSEAIQSGVTQRQVDSPVYTFLPSLQPPAMGVRRADAPPMVPRFASSRKPRCFVVMGFGEKVDFPRARTLNLDASYRVIKRAVEEAGLECVRADEITHSGTIDRPMYEYLLTADIVIADLSTSNANALLELGVRHGLRPFSTIVIAEEQFQFPFDINHMLIVRYRHLGTGIDYEEAERMRAQLGELIKVRMARPEVDSPVYSFLPGLQPPTLQAAAEPREASEVEALTKTMQEAMTAAKWTDAMAIGQRLVLLAPSDPSPVRQLALATYKSRQPDAASALAAAKSILAELEPLQSGDPQTLGLWAAVHKRQWELSSDRSALDEAIAALDLAFTLDSDYRNGVNLAFLLIARASSLPFDVGVADRGKAERTYRQVIAICDGLIRTSDIGPEGGSADPTEMFWIKAALAEAFVGAGETARANELEAGVMATAPEPWMAESFKDQMRKVREMLSRPPAP
jgi:tetratricopeptide repeat protein